MPQKSWYPVENGKSVIELKLESLEQLFDNRDPNPYRRRDLDDDVHEYIFSCAQEIGLHKIGKLRLLCPTNFDRMSEGTAKLGIREYFLYRKEITEKLVHSIISLGVKTLFIGLVFLSFAIATSAMIKSVAMDSFLGSFLKEGLLLIGWVSMWKPVNIFLYEWWPLIDKKRIYEKLHMIEIEIQRIQE